MVRPSLKWSGRTRRMAFGGAAILAALPFLGDGAQAQKPAPDGMTLEIAASKRYPQPVRVADLVGHPVLQPVPSRTVLGRVQQIVRSAEGTIQVVIAYGGLLGFGARPIAVPVEAMALLGWDMEVLDFKPAQLDGFPTFTGTGATPVAADEVIRVGLAAPSH